MLDLEGAAATARPRRARRARAGAAAARVLLLLLVAVLAAVAQALLAAGPSSLAFVGSPSLLTGIAGRRRLALPGVAGGERHARLALRAKAAGLQGLTVRELKQRLREEGLPVSGKKAVLVARLEEYLAAQETAAEVVEEVAEATEVTEAADIAEAVSEVVEEVAEAVEVVEASSEPAPFQAGDLVEVCYEDDAWYPATVQRDHSDGTFMVTLHEDDSEYTCTSDKMKMVKKAEAPAAFFAGDTVEAFWEEEEQWYPARVKMNNGNGEFIIVWQQDRHEHHCAPEHMRYSKPKLPLRRLKQGQKFKGKVDRSFKYGTFVDIGAECNGLVAPFYMYEGEEEPLSVGDSVQALYEEENRFYPARIVRDNEDGTFTVAWDEDDAECEVKKKDVHLMKPQGVKEGAEVDVWVNEITTGPSGDQRLSLTMVESKVGQKKPAPASPFDGLSVGKWLQGSVLSTPAFGILVNVDSPSGGNPVRGLVHITQIRDGFVEKTEDEVEIGQEVKVRVTAVDARAGRLDLSMKP